MGLIQTNKSRAAVLLQAAYATECDLDSPVALDLRPDLPCTLALASSAQFADSVAQLSRAVPRHCFAHASGVPPTLDDS